MRKFIVSALSILMWLPALGWGQKGHDVVAYIAECNLTPEVYQKVVKALGNHSLVYYASWLDNASHTPTYAYTKTWHYANVDEGETYDSMELNPTGDVYTAINEIVKELKKGKLKPEKEDINLRMLIHLVGDLHCPMHLGHKSDSGGNRISVKYFGRTSKLHSIWDSSLIDSAHKWSYTEWEQQLNKYCTPEQKEQLQSGTLRDWLDESLELAKDVYANTPAESTLSYDYVNHYAPTLENRLLAGGLRLAKILNEIYGD